MTSETALEPPASVSRARGLAHWAELAFILALYARMLMVFVPTVTTNPANALVLTSEGLVVLFVVFRRGARNLSVRPFDWLIAFAGTAAPLLVHPAQAGHHDENLVRFAFIFLIFGLSFSIWGKLTLRRSFGLVAANRGVVATGPFKFMRHPIYAGYLIGDIGAWIANPLALNAVLYLVTTTIVILRILAEERVLGLDPEYRDFMSRTRFRLIPGLF